MTSLSDRPQNRNFGKRARRASIARGKRNKSEYYLNPNYSKHCNEFLPYNSNKFFCNCSCASTYNNIQRVRNAETNIKISESLKRYNGTSTVRKFTKIQFSICELCHNNFYVKHHKNIKTNICGACKNQNYSLVHTSTCRCCDLMFVTKTHRKYCNNCSPNIRHYRSRCKFSFNVYQYPNEFDIELIKTYGWYSPGGKYCKNSNINLTGVSRDHLYSVSDGFSNDINPKLLSHPANCGIMLHNGKGGNNSKNGNSSITLEELKLRILEWDNRYL